MPDQLVVQLVEIELSDVPADLTFPRPLSEEPPAIIRLNAKAGCNYFEQQIRFIERTSN